MIRTEALAYIQGIANSIMTQAGRLTTDSATGYGPALDAVFATYGDDEVADEEVTGFTAALEGATYDLVLPAFALYVDTSVDAPLTSVKGSQVFRQVMALRDAAWARAKEYGFGPMNVNVFAFVLDHLEPGRETAGNEFGGSDS